MFTGIVEEVGKVLGIQEVELEGVVLTIGASTVLQDVHLGDSIAVNGTCLTVTEFTTSSFTVGLSPETVKRTNLGSLKVDSAVNLERAMLASQRFGGHFVQGHVDATCKILEKTREKESLWLKLSMPEGYARYFIPKGYVCLDGTSLTVCDVVDDAEQSYFTVMLVAFTQKHVILPLKEVGDSCNVEVDIVGKYIQRNLVLQQQQPETATLTR